MPSPAPCPSYLFDPLWSVLSHCFSRIFLQVTKNNCFCHLPIGFIQTVQHPWVKNDDQAWNHWVRGLEETQHTNENKVRSIQQILVTTWWIQIPCVHRIYLFSVQNPKEVENNGKPRLEEVGPFTYTEETERINEVFSEVSKIVRFSVSVKFSRSHDVCLLSVRPSSGQSLSFWSQHSLFSALGKPW